MILRRILLLAPFLLVLASPVPGREPTWVGPDLWNDAWLGESAVDGAAPVLLPGGEAQLLVYCGRDEDGGASFWSSDGTREGTVRLGRPWPDAFGPLWGPVSHDGAAWMLAGTVEDGVGLYRTDGTPEGTAVAIPPDPDHGLEGRLFEWKGRLWCAGRTAATEPWTLYASDGTPEGTGPVRSVAPPALSWWSYWSPAQPAGDLLYFFGTTEEEGRELWRTDGTEEGTFLLADVRPGPEGQATYVVWGTPDCMVGSPAGNALCFAADDGVSGVEPWRTDGTPEGTFRVADLNPGPATSQPMFLGEAGGGFLFFADDGVRGRALWRSDGTGPGATLFRDFDPESAEAPYPFALGALDGVLIFTIHQEEGALQLWRTDGTAEGTLLSGVPQTGSPGFYPMGDFRLLGSSGLATFRVGWGDWPDYYWITDGTAEGTREISDWNAPLLWKGSVFWTGESPRRLLTVAGDLGRSRSDLDEDEDSFSTELELALGSRWWDGASTPLGPGGGGEVKALAVEDAGFRLTGWKAARDGLHVAARLQVDPDLRREGASLTVDAGGVIRTFTLDRRGRGRSGDARVRLRFDRGGVDREERGAHLRFTVRRGSLIDPLADEGIWPMDPVEDQPLDLPVTVLLDSRRYRARAPLLWTVSSWGSGRARK